MDVYMKARSMHLWHNTRSVGNNLDSNMTPIEIIQIRQLYDSINMVHLTYLRSLFKEERQKSESVPKM